MYLNANGLPGRAGVADRLSTGIAFLDEQIGGGLVPGRLVCLRTAPGSQGELLLRELATATGARYLSTTRTENAVAEWLSGEGSEVDVVCLGTDEAPRRGRDAIRERVERAAGWSAGQPGVEPAAPIEAATVAIGSCEGSVAIDPANPLERGEPSAYLAFLRRLQRRVRAIESVAFLHVVDTGAPPGGRWLTLQMADEVWSVSVDVHNRRVEFLLTVTKSRSGAVPDRQLKLDLGRDVRVDTSRDIA